MLNLKDLVAKCWANLRLTQSYVVLYFWIIDIGDKLNIILISVALVKTNFNG